MKLFRIYFLNLLQFHRLKPLKNNKFYKRNSHNITEVGVTIIVKVFQLILLCRRLRIKDDLRCEVGPTEFN